MTTLAGAPARAPAIGWVAALWAGTYGFVALIWTATGSGYPFHHADDISLWSRLDPAVGAPLLAQLLLASAVAAVAMSGSHMERLTGGARVALVLFGWASAAVLALVVPGASLLALTGYAPLLLIAAPFGWVDVDLRAVFDAGLLNQAWSVLGGVLVGATVLSWQRRTSQGRQWVQRSGAHGQAALPDSSRWACVDCGRNDRAPRIPLQRWSRWAVGAAVAVPLTYALTRFAWALGIPFGLSRAEVDELRAGDGLWAAVGLASFATVGAVLTLGLVQRWGEVFPRWMVGLAGRRVPVSMAVVPAMYVAAMVFAGGLALIGEPRLWEQGFLLMLPHLLWPLWGVALAVAAYAYKLRRRGACADCGREG